MRHDAARLRPALALVLLAWFAQLCLPVAHAGMMAAARGQMPGWCGEPARGLAIVAQLPAEIREALQPDGASAEHLASCTQLCATGATPTPTPAANTVVLRAAGLAPAPDSGTPAPRGPEPGLTPPSHGPPAQA